MKDMLAQLRRLSADKKKIKKIIFSVVVLTVLLAVSITAVSGWVETISTILIKGDGDIDTSTYTNATVNKTSNNSIDLTKYFREAGNVHLSEASSADGMNFYFPVVSSTGNTKYRLSNINDVCVNYITFTCKVQSETTNDFIFNKVPVIKIGENVVNDSSVRVAITIDGVTKIFSHTASLENEKVVAAVDGTTANTEYHQFLDYVYNDNNVFSEVFTLTANTAKDLTVAIWLQEGISTYDISGKEISISDLTLVPTGQRFKVEATAVTDDKEKDVTGGTVQVNSAAAGEYSYDNVAADTDVTLTAVVKDGFKFIGWYDAATGGTLKSSNTEYTFKADMDYQLYARFATGCKVIAHAVTNGELSNIGGNVQSGTSTAGADSQFTVGKGGEVTVKATCANNNYAFVGWYDQVSGGTRLDTANTDNSYTISNVTENKELYARFESQYLITAHAVTDGNNNNLTGGTVKVSGANAGATSSNYVLKDRSVTLTATLTTGYKFDGWWTAATGGTQLDAGVTYDDVISYTIDNVTAAQNVYARFTYNMYTVTANAATGTDYSTAGGGKVTISGVDGSDTSKTTTVTKNETVTITAIADDNYTFVGWYNGTTKLTSDVDGIEISGTNGEIITITKSSDYNVTARFDKDKQIVYIGVIEFQQTVATDTTLKVHCWDPASDVTPTPLDKEEYFAVGSDYWSGEEKKFKMYKAELPTDVTKMKAWADYGNNDSNKWYGDDYTISDGNCLLIFEYSGNYLAKQINYNPNN